MKANNRDIGQKDLTEAHETSMTRNANALLGRVDRYYQWNLSLFPIRQGARILDVGAGMGLYLDALKAYRPARYTATDRSIVMVRDMRKRMAGYPGMQARVLDVLDPASIDAFDGGCHDYILCFDVLEHLENDTLAVAHLVQLMTIVRAEYLFLRVPACPFLYGSNDAAIGHFRRYTRSGLRSILAQANLETETIRYQNLAGIVPWFFRGRILRRTLAASPSEGRLFNAMTPWLRLLEKTIPVPLELSLFAICKNTEKRHSQKGNGS